MSRIFSSKFLVGWLAILVALLLTGCGSSKSVNNNNSTGGGTVTNSVALSAGPGSFTNGYVNGLYTTITICQPGTSNCTSLDHILVDTGSSGLRIVASELPSGFTLTTETSGSNSVYECLPFLDSYTWGNVVTADLEIAGEKASSLPVQMITANTAPSYCANTISTSGNPEVSTELEVGARGILGIGNFASDCGTYCTTVQQFDIYFACSSTAASSCSQVGTPVAQQVNNPVSYFGTDKNGVAVQLGSVPAGGADSASGTLYFGIGTQADNTPASGVTVIGLDDTADFTTTFQSKLLANSFFDTGSNAYFFGTINTSTLVTSTGITGCNLASSGQPAAYFYCPSSELSESATLASFSSSATTTVNFNVGNANTLKGTVFSDLAGPNTTNELNAGTSFDWGLPFFFGRTVYVGLEGASSSLGNGLYVAF